MCVQESLSRLSLHSSYCTIVVFECMLSRSTSLRHYMCFVFVFLSTQFACAFVDYIFSESAVSLCSMQNRATVIIKPLASTKLSLLLSARAVVSSSSVAVDDNTEDIDDSNDVEEDDQTHQKNMLQILAKGLWVSLSLLENTSSPFYSQSFHLASQHCFVTSDAHVEICSVYNIYFRRKSQVLCKK